MRRGEIRTAILAVLTDGPGHGYDVIQRLEAKSGGAWRPSAGSVYPTLQLLEDEGLVALTEHDGKRIYELTGSGRAEAENRLRDAGRAPWEQSAGDRPFGDLREAVRHLHIATKQVAAAGNAAQVDRAVAIVRQARKDLYQLLAED